MKKKILIPVSMAAMFLCASWQAAETTVSPDRLFLADNEKSFLVSCQCHDAGCEWKTLGGMRRKLRYDVRIGRQETFGAI